MADAIKISDLPDPSSFGSEDFFVVNDVTGSDQVTSKLTVGEFVSWITRQELEFTQPIQVTEIIPGDDGLNITVNSINIEVIFI